MLRASLDKNNLSNVTVVAADGSWGISGDILKDQTLAQAVGVIGYVEHSVSGSLLLVGRV